VTLQSTGESHFRRTDGEAFEGIPLLPLALIIYKTIAIIPNMLANVRIASCFLSSSSLLRPILNVDHHKEENPLFDSPQG
jgi:hypothetical protein